MGAKHSRSAAPDRTPRTAAPPSTPAATPHAGAPPRWSAPHGDGRTTLHVPRGRTHDGSCCTATRATLHVPWAWTHVDPYCTATDARWLMSHGPGRTSVHVARRQARDGSCRSAGRREIGGQGGDARGRPSSPFSRLPALLQEAARLCATKRAGRRRGGVCPAPPAGPGGCGQAGAPPISRGSGPGSPAARPRPPPRSAARGRASSSTASSSRHTGR